MRLNKTMIINNYHSLFILGSVLALYGFTWFLVKFKKINLITHRRIWTIILLVSFLLSAILGLVLAVFLDQKLSIAWYRGMLWWHVETGIVMAIISIFHALWHGQYFLSVFKKRKNENGK